MSKNRGACFLGSDTAGYHDYRIRQLMQLPVGATVMVVDTDQNDEVTMRDCIETAGAYCVALVEDKEGKTEALPYNLGTHGGLDVRASIVPVRYCPKCHERMHMTMEECEETTLRYACKNCDHQESAWTEAE